MIDRRASDLWTYCLYVCATLAAITVVEASTLPSTKNAASDSQSPVLLIVSFDGFRPDYLNENITPTLNEFRSAGVRSEYMRNVFPTKTFVNHFSIATGLYSGSHGVVGNEFYDHKLKRNIKYSYDMFHYNEAVLPIWTVNEMAGHRSGCMMWPGSNFAYNGNRTTCTYSQSFNQTTPWREKVDTVMKWLSDPVKPANLIMLYFNEPDFHGHVFSPDSKEVRDKIVVTDQVAAYIKKGLIDNALSDRANIIYLSDHGMESLLSANFINLTELSDNSTYSIYGNSPVLQIVPNVGKEVQVLNDIMAASKKNGHFKVYTPDTLPSRWHAYSPSRLGPIVAVADIKYGFQDIYQWLTYYVRDFNISLTPDHKYGLHGYDNAEPSMRAMFMANGPAFVKNRSFDPFDSVDLFNLFATVLEIGNPQLPDNNGTFSHVRGMLLRNGEEEQQMSASKKFAAIGLPILLILAIVSGSAFCYMRYRKRRHMENEYILEAKEQHDFCG